ncbi:ABC transporter permease [Streptomyces sp. RB6PN25]|uniref:ABC transporter permease n=1 Tax=Streptomyces humicola TaxID=2953240 RepID=A0ABT1PSZ5_9ACTN|nr:ABC transporter permease [Streptomyces humicola]MCQ4080243.1 ABC transporter permease [Streptomyces humicola]
MTSTRPAAAARLPIALVLPALAAVCFLALPLAGVLARTPWSTLPDQLTSPEVTQALWLSLTVSLWALGLAVVLGVPLAWILARVDFPGKPAVRALVMLPMVLPPTVGGVALLMGFGRRGLLGPLLADFGVTLPFSTPGAVVAAAFVAMPFLVISLEGTLTSLHPRYEETAASLGARPLRAFLTVTVPMAAPGLVAAAALCWARALGEFGATITFAGNLPGVTQTLPLNVYLLLQDNPEGATSVSLLLLVVAMVVLTGLRGRWTGSGARTATAADPAPAAAPDAVLDAVEAEAEAPAPAASATVPTEPPPERWPLKTTVTGFTRLSLEAEPGTTVAVVGPNGAGKTTLLRALLGLTHRAHAEQLLLGAVDAAGAPPHKRGVAWVPQDGALFPHLTVLGNTAYGLRAQGVPRRSARAQAQLWLDRLGVGDLADRKPGRISGGQAGRVALARALAVRPRLLLLDEPLAALDQTTRAKVRHTLREHLAGFTGACLIVTHDPVEAVTLADRVLVLEDGRAVQYASPADVARHPRSPWVARMLGRNAWAGTAKADGLELPGGARLVAAEPLPEGTAALAVVGPEAVSLHRVRPSGSPRNVWQGQVRELTALGSRMRALVTSDGLDALAEITASAAAELALAEGGTVWVSVKATEITLVAL